MQPVSALDWTEGYGILVLMVFAIVFALSLSTWFLADLLKSMEKKEERYNAAVQSTLRTYHLQNSEYRHTLDAYARTIAELEAQNQAYRDILQVNDLLPPTITTQDPAQIDWVESHPTTRI